MIRDLLRLTKPGIVFMISVTAAVGYITAANGIVEPGHFIAAIAATTLMAAGAAAVNQILERNYDAQMRRTQRRPLPSGAVGLRSAIAFAGLVTSTGLVIALVRLPALTTALLVTCFVTYVIYTELKRQTSACTLVGAIPGALPVLAGWTATGASVTPTAIALVAVMFLWQMPHFLAIGWLARDDYARAGFRILSVTDSDGSMSGRISLVYASMLLPVSIIPALTGGASMGYCALAIMAGGTFAWRSGRFARLRTTANARMLFLTSLVYLPTVFFGLLLL